MKPLIFRLIVVVVVVVAILGAAAAELDDHTCTACEPYSDCSDCDQAAGRCCSWAYYCGGGDLYCWPCYDDEGNTVHPCRCYHHLCFLHDQGEQQLGGRHAIANSTLYNARQEDYVLVATYDRNLSMNTSSSVHEYAAAAICGPSSSSLSTTHVSATNIVPGQCLQVTNIENGKQATVRIIDKQNCGSTSLIFTYEVFQRLGTSGNRNAGGHLSISYKHVHCIDN